MTRLFDLLYNQLQHLPLEQALSHRNHQNIWQSYSTQELVSMAEQAASGLLSLGLKPGDKVALVSYKNRSEWIIMDFAIQMAGMISVPLYPTISIDQYQYILQESEAKAAFCGGGDLQDKLKAAQKNVTSLKHIFVFDDHIAGKHWTQIFDDTHKDTVKKIKAEICSEDLATIIYTSGTMGDPKGVMLSHQNILHVANYALKQLPADPGEKVLSILPLSHIFERTITMAYILKGLKVHFAGTDNLSGPNGDLQAVQPVAFSAVPRLLEKVYEAIYKKGLALNGIKKQLFFWALKLTNGYDFNQKLSLSKRLQWAIADQLIFSKWRAALGGQLRVIVTGAAPCPKKVVQVFCAAGIPIREGYGLTETSPTVTVNTMEPDGALMGTTGYVIDGVKIKIDHEGDYRKGEGEILVNGPIVMQGYYKKPEETQKVFVTIDGEQWFCTGDIGKLVKGPTGRNFLKITDRKKQLLKTSGGKYVAPAPIENKMKENFLVEQMMVVGDKQKFVSALIVPAEDTLKGWCQHKGMAWKGIKEMIKEPKVIKKYQAIIDHYNPRFNHIEQVKKFKLIPQQWQASYTDGSEAELTPTLKLKRRVILEKFAQEIADIYAD